MFASCFAASSAAEYIHVCVCVCVCVCVFGHVFLFVYLHAGHRLAKPPQAATVDTQPSSIRR